MPSHFSSYFKVVRKIFFLLLGSFFAALGIDLFLVPHNIIDGGVVGISILLSYVTKFPLGLFIFALNTPFFIFGYKQIGKSFAISTLFSVLSLSLWVTFLHPFPVLTDDIFLASVFGGIIVGIGVGLIIRYGGSLDGTEVVAIVLDKKTGFSVGEIVMFFNLFILSSAGLVFGWDRAMYSIVTYFIAFKIIDLTIEGLDESKAVMIVSDKPEVIAKALMARLGRGVTLIHGKGGYSGHSKSVLYSVVTRLEISKLKSIVSEIDERAFVTISDVHEVMGGRLMKRDIH
ncbi:MAG: hypothetical protein DKM50_11445 [Candidatus Margulisiibacteriota bacterium]|nr:MAG: hypothetical protein A2X43_12065 [Candidatus Margulisbacteria bacterium GWD2_39_127]OGI03191.1 MAG: hypothetical protein A2X42_11305 [Candidatus Margulisbacteria bacterium GWF2_38_17]OGI11215.1 MAG: hypothetical protein A2X41_03730 [Candidatus Margulisbacteria bacterium GWE2_39_32]PZM78570.1 MAG: hypothetical protein DKM50_11445 [Candidatus Margulisiibacteriota bacterium]HAR63863.1 hypothetical protein [Candidatus Margulisiibacteriota bacterium]